jgi:hypothetical protein
MRPFISLWGVVCSMIVMLKFWVPHFWMFWLQNIAIQDICTQVRAKYITPSIRKSVGALIQIWTKLN